MRETVMMGVILGLSFTAGPSYSQSGPAGAPCCPAQEKAANPVETVINKLQGKAADLKSYECKVDYVVRQPLLESQTRQRGLLSYAKFDKRSYLRIDFNTLQQNEEKEQKFREQFLFDGVWLSYIEYETENARRQQMSEPNKPIDAFALVSQRVPLLGFSKIEELQKQFEVELVRQTESEPSTFHVLHLKVKPDSVYKDDYVTIDFWIDKKLGLPVKVIAVTTEEDIYEIKLLEPKVNKGIDTSVFEVSIPKGFSVETVPLERKTGQN